MTQTGKGSNERVPEARKTKKGRQAKRSVCKTVAERKKKKKKKEFPSEIIWFRREGRPDYYRSHPPLPRFIISSAAKKGVEPLLLLRSTMDGKRTPRRAAPIAGLPLAKGGSPQCPPSARTDSERENSQTVLSGSLSLARKSKKKKREENKVYLCFSLHKPHREAPQLAARLASTPSTDSFEVPIEEKRKGEEEGNQDLFQLYVREEARSR